LHDIDGLTTKETARLLGVPEGTVKARVARARGKLARIMRGGSLAGSARELFPLMHPHAERTRCAGEQIRPRVEMQLGHILLQPKTNKVIAKCSD
jgi:hypothetical protein